MVNDENYRENPQVIPVISQGNTQLVRMLKFSIDIALQKSKQKVLEIIEELKTDLMNEGKRLAKIEDKRKKGEWIGKHEGSLTIGINVMRILIKYQKRIEEEL